MEIKNVNLEGMIFSSRELEGVNFSGSNLTEASFFCATLNRACFQKTLLVDSYFFKSSGRLAQFDYANCTNANMSEADFYGASLTEANLTNANLSETKLICASVNSANLTNARLWKANLACADLANANLTDADLSFANLRNTCLTKANLQGANLWGADLTGTRLQGAIGLGSKESEIEIAKKILEVLDSGKGFLDLSFNPQNRDRDYSLSGWAGILSQNPEISDGELSRLYPTLAKYYNSSSHKKVQTALNKIASGLLSVFSN